jgi:hypothetical protein
MPSDVKKWDVLRRPIRPFVIAGVAIPVGVGNVFGARVTVIDARAIGYRQLMLEHIYESRGGTFASGETVTVRHICVYEDGSEDSYDRSYTTTGAVDYLVNASEFAYFRHSTKVPVAYVAQAKSNLSSTSVIITNTVKGWMW